MSSFALNKAIHHVYTDRERTAQFKRGDFAMLDAFDLTTDERAALEASDLPGLWAMDVHPVLLFHLSAVLYPREWYIKEVVPKIRDVPNYWYDYYRTGQQQAQ